MPGYSHLVVNRYCLVVCCLPTMMALGGALFSFSFVDEALCRSVSTPASAWAWTAAADNVHTGSRADGTLLSDRPIYAQVRRSTVSLPSF